MGALRSGWPHFCREIANALVEEEDAVEAETEGDIAHPDIMRELIDELGTSAARAYRRRTGVNLNDRQVVAARIAYLDPQGQFEGQLAEADRDFAQLERLRTHLAEIDESLPPLTVAERLADSPLPDAMDEPALAKLIEDTYETLWEQYEPRFAETYANAVVGVFEKFNLPYRVDRPLRVMPLIVGRMTEVYHALSTTPGDHDDLPEFLTEFEYAYSRLWKNADDGDVFSPLHRISNFLEATGGEAVGKRGKSVGDIAQACEEQGRFPHKGALQNSLRTLAAFAAGQPNGGAIREKLGEIEALIEDAPEAEALRQSLKSLYGFLSGYPRVRHAGDPSKSHRSLSANDTEFISLLLLVWSAYLASMRPAAHTVVRSGE